VVGQVPVPLPPVVAQPVDDALETTQGVARRVDDLAGPLLPRPYGRPPRASGGDVRVGTRA